MTGNGQRKRDTRCVITMKEYTTALRNAEAYFGDYQDARQFIGNERDMTLGKEYFTFPAPKAARIRLLASPHYVALLKAHFINYPESPPHE